MADRFTMKRVLTIAGSDSGGGAGIQADLKTFSAHGVFGMTALTAVTAQNTVGVQGIHEIPADFVGRQIDSVMSDIGADAWKTGMLINSEIIHVVADRVKHHGIENLIVDPVMVAKGGDTLLHEKARNVLITDLIPLAYAVTPNLHEAEVLTGMVIRTIGDMYDSASVIQKLGARYVVVKGGHLLDSVEAIDVLFDGEEFTEFKAVRIQTANTHGTGCTFASAIASEIAKGLKMTAAVREAKVYMTATIKAAVDLSIGRGHGPLNHFIHV